jgi:hypothetical protein
MTILHAIAKARAGAQRIRRLTIPSTELANALEEVVAIEHMCKLVEKNLLKPAPSSDIAKAIFFKAEGRRLVVAMRTPGQHMKEHGLRADVKAVRAKS